MAKKASSTEYKPTHEEIARRAQEIYLANGGLGGKDVENWLQAEAQLLAEHQRPTQERPAERPMVRAQRAR